MVFEPDMDTVQDCWFNREGDGHSNKLGSRTGLEDGEGEPGHESRYGAHEG